MLPEKHTPETARDQNQKSFPSKTPIGVQLTERAAARVSKAINDREKGLGLRLAVKKSGCSGLAYQLEYVDELNPIDFSFQSHGVKVFVDPSSLPFLDGTTLDFVREGLNEGFSFENPNVTDSCGCGESFTTG